MVLCILAGRPQTDNYIELMLFCFLLGGLTVLRCGRADVAKDGVIPLGLGAHELLRHAGGRKRSAQDHLDDGFFLAMRC